MLKRHRTLRMERMEAREMMAGDVAAAVVNGNLYLNEAAGQAGRDNSVLISQIAPGRIRVTGNGTTTDGTVSRINGAAFQDFNVPGGLIVKFGGGSDLVVFDGAAPPSFQDVNIDLAAPPILVASMTVGGISLTPPDKDNVMIWNATIRGSLTVNTGRDNDWVYVANAKIGDGIGLDNITINTGAGADTAELKNLQGTLNGAIDIQLFSSLLELDADVAWLDHVYANGNIGIRGGGGNDLLHLDNVTSYKDVNLDAGAGDDKVEVNYLVAVNNFFASLGDGNDTMTTNDLYLGAGKAQIDGGSGFDSFARTGAFPTAGQVSLTNFERINGRLVLLVSPIVTGGVLTKL
jgi:hypothetical protein